MIIDVLLLSSALPQSQDVIGPGQILILEQAGRRLLSSGVMNTLPMFRRNQWNEIAIP